MRDKVFISYSHEDEKWLRRLQVHLRPLERDYNVDIWDDTKITPGSRWKHEIREAIDSTKVAVLLISADFIASDFIATDELPPLLKAAEEDGAMILPLILSPCRFLQNKDLSQFQTVNDPSQPLIGLSKAKQEEVWYELAVAIETSIQQDEVGQNHARDRATIASQALSQTMAMVFVDIMRLLYVASGHIANMDSYPKFITILERHFQDLDARMTGFSRELDTEVREQVYQLRTNLSFMSGRLMRSLNPPDNNINDFVSMEKIAKRLHDFCLLVGGEEYRDVVENVKAKFGQALMQNHSSLNSMSLNNVCILRFKIQDQLLEESRKSGEAMIFTIADDMDHGFATKYFVIDYVLLCSRDW